MTRTDLPPERRPGSEPQRSERVTRSPEVKREASERGKGSDGWRVHVDLELIDVEVDRVD